MFGCKYNVNDDGTRASGPQREMEKRTSLLSSNGWIKRDNLTVGLNYCNIDIIDIIDSMDFLRISYGFPIDLLCICYGFALDLLWIAYEFHVDVL